VEQVHHNRLRKLANHLLSFTAEQNARHFRMRVFLEHDQKELQPLEALAQQVLADCYCETIACAVGHAPALFPSLMKKFDKEHGWWDVQDVWDAEAQDYVEKKVWILPSWREVSKFLFDINSGSEEFEFLFGGDWDTGRYHDYKSTSWAVADRIYYFLDNPDTYRDSYYGWRYYAARKGKASEAVLGKMMDELTILEQSGKVQAAITQWD